MKTFLLLFILSLSIYGKAQKSKTFNIKRSTTFFNELGEQISFEDFSYITSHFKHNILPKFKTTGELDYIVLRYPPEADKYIGKTSLPSKKTIQNQYSNSFNTSSLNSDFYSTVQELKNNKAPNFSILDQNNSLVNTDDLLGTVVVLKFWFSKCVPCIEEIPELNKLVDNYSNKNIKFYAPSVESKELAQSFLSKHIFKYNTLFEAQDIAALYKTPGYPTHVVIGKDGKVRKVVVGKRTNIYKILNEEIKKALLVEDDDIDVVDFDDNEDLVLNDETIIYNENGELIHKEEYIYRLNTGRYKVYKKLKKNGKINLLLTIKN